jgi:hypothetical protein
MEAVNKVVAKAAGVSTSSAAGKVVGGGSALRGQHSFDIYNLGTVVMAELIIRYTQRARLVRLCPLRSSLVATQAQTRRFRFVFVSVLIRRRWDC